MVEIQAAERCEPPGIIIELPTELPRPRIGSAGVSVAGELGREQRGAERHLKIQARARPARAYPIALRPVPGLGEIGRPLRHSPTCSPRPRRLCASTRSPAPDNSLA